MLPAAASPRVLVAAPAVSALEQLEAHMLSMPQIAAQVVNRFGPGVYVREMQMPAGAQFLGHEHTAEHWNIVLSGRARLHMDGVTRTIAAGDVFLSRAGSRKFVVIEEAMRFLTIHPNPGDETDLAKLEAVHIRKSETFQAAAIVRGLMEGGA